MSKIRRKNKKRNKSVKLLILVLLLAVIALGRVIFTDCIPDKGSENETENDINSTVDILDTDDNAVSDEDEDMDSEANEGEDISDETEGQPEDEGDAEGNDSTEKEDGKPGDSFGQDVNTTSDPKASKTDGARLVSADEYYGDTKPTAVDAYYLTNGDPTTGKDKTINGIPEPEDVLMWDNGDDLVLVNKYHAVSSDYKPKNMVYMDNKMTTYQDLELKSEAYEAYKKLYKDACQQGFDLKVCSAYRKYQTQTGLYVNSLKNRGRETTNLRSAYPGRSEHHTGLCVDITSKSMGMTLSQDFADYKDGKWLNEHCQDYGFILRYPKGKTDVTGYAYEPWHFRYVGVEVAKDIMSRGITLEEYIQEQKA